MILRTVSQGDYGTYGMLIADDTVIAHTCEDAWEDNARMVSCIPAGTYKCVRRESPKYGHHWHVLGVPKRDLILIHAGNTPEDTNGCILVGDSFMRQKDMTIIGVKNSRLTMAKLREILPDEFELKVER